MHQTAVPTCHSLSFRVAPCVAPAAAEWKCTTSCVVPATRPGHQGPYDAPQPPSLPSRQVSQVPCPGPLASGFVAAACAPRLQGSPRPGNPRLSTAAPAAVPALLAGPGVPLRLPGHRAAPFCPACRGARHHPAAGHPLLTSPRHTFHYNVKRRRILRMWLHLWAWGPYINESAVQCWEEGGEVC